MAEEGITGGICHANYWHAEVVNKYMKHYDKNKESSYLKYWNVHNYMNGQSHKRCLYTVLNGMRKHLNLVKIS